MQKNNESIEQIALFEWAARMEHQCPELKLLHHIPNGGKRAKKTAIQLKMEGVKAGVPDVCLPVARGKRRYRKIFSLKKIGALKMPGKPVPGSSIKKLYDFNVEIEDTADIIDDLDIVESEYFLVFDTAEQLDKAKEAIKDYNAITDSEYVINACGLHDKTDELASEIISLLRRNHMTVAQTKQVLSKVIDFADDKIQKSLL